MLIRARQPGLLLGGWANPARDPAAQVGYLLAPKATADFYLTQIVSHHDPASVADFLDEGRRRELAIPGLFGVFYYRSANPRTLATLGRFLDVPAEALTRDPANADGLLERGVLTLEAGDVGAARSDFAAVLVTAPDSPAAELARNYLDQLDDAQTK